MRIPFWLPFVILLFSLGCKKSEERTCTKSEGENSELLVPLSTGFRKIHLEDDLHLVLVKDTAERLIIRGGENMVGLVQVEQQADQITFSNNSKCYFLRNFRHDVTLYLHCNSLREIHVHGFGSVSTAGTFESDSLWFNSWNSTGVHSLNLSCDYLYAGIHSGPAEITLSGKTSEIVLYGASYGFFRAEAMESERAFVHSLGTGDSYVNCRDVLIATTEGTGSVYYKGAPAQIDRRGNGSGTIQPL